MGIVEVEPQKNDRDLTAVIINTPDTKHRESSEENTRVVMENSEVLGNTTATTAGVELRKEKEESIQSPGIFSFFGLKGSRNSKLLKKQKKKKSGKDGTRNNRKKVSDSNLSCQSQSPIKNRRILKVTKPPSPINQNNVSSEQVQVLEGEKDTKIYHGVKEHFLEHQQHTLEQKKRERTDEISETQKQNRNELQIQKRNEVVKTDNEKGEHTATTKLCPQIFSVKPKFPEHKRKQTDTMELEEKKRKVDPSMPESSKDEKDNNENEKGTSPPSIQSGLALLFMGVAAYIVVSKMIFRRT